MDFHQRVITAGIYVLAENCFIFQVGPTKTGETLGVVRVGGHREGNETGWECAAREACEEASLRVVPLKPPATYWGGIATGELEEPPTWYAPSPDDITPILITRRHADAITPIYLGYSHDTPRAAAEAKALLLLRPTDIQFLTTETVTLEHYLAQGGKIVYREELPRHLVLEPAGHLRWLHKLIQMHPEIANISDITPGEQSAERNQVL